MTPQNHASVRWSVGASIAMELDLVLTAASGYFLPSSLPEEYANLMKGLPPDWLAELPTYFGQNPAFSSLLEVTAYLAGVLQADDYTQASIAMREMDIRQAYDRIASIAQLQGYPIPSDQPSPDQFIEFTANYLTSAFSKAGFNPVEIATRLAQANQQLRRVVRILRDGDLSSRFWHWLDRIYFQIYQPWRKSRSQAIEMEIRRAASALGGLQGGTAPQIDWLPPQNPLRRLHNIMQTVNDHQMPVFFWAEPFGMMDAWGLYPDLVTVSYAQPGIVFENFRTGAEDIAGRIAALGDPTRLIILRMIRQFGMDNTEIAAYLGVARPTVSIHAKILREAGLIRSYPVGRAVRHEVNPQEVRRLYQDLQHFLDLPTLDPSDEA